jgi:hypothetical protein
MWPTTSFVALLRYGCHWLCQCFSPFGTGAFLWAIALFVARIPAQVNEPAAAVDAAPRIADCRVGFDGCYKVGYWTPIWVAMSGDVTGSRPIVKIATSDSDGVEVTFTEELPIDGDSVEGLWPVQMYAKVGRLGSAIRMALVAEDGRVLDRRELPAPHPPSSQSTIAALPSMSELILQYGADIGLADALPDRDATSSSLARRVVQISDPDALPTDWYGYEGVDLVVISADDAERCQRLAEDARRFAALTQWIELGGRLAILCGGETAPRVLGEAGSLAPLVPGNLAEVVPLSETQSLEQFVEPAPSISSEGSGAAMRVPRLVDVSGKIEVDAGRSPADLPLVVRSARGLGEVTFAAVDLTRPPLAEWPGRKAFLQALLRPYLTPPDQHDERQTLVTRGYIDLSGALRQRLGRSFGGVAPVGFSLVALLAIGYLVVLGPIDYLLVRRWLRSPLAGWITFPILVLACGLGGLALANWRQGPDRPHVNRAELVDVDTVSGRARGTLWASLYSPRANRFDLGVQRQAVGGQPPGQTDAVLSCWGTPGGVIGGMEARNSDLGIVGNGYRYTAGLAEVEDVPVLTAATKSFLARWHMSAPALLEAQLADESGLATGSVVNHTGHSLRNVRLLYGEWGYRLGDLPDGGRLEVGGELAARSVKTIVTASALGGTERGPAGSAGGNQFFADRASVNELLNLMTFYGVAGGVDFAGLPNRYQAYCDMSRLLAVGRAILIAETGESLSQLVDRDSGEPLGDATDFTTTVWRFVLPVATEAEQR